MIERKKCVVNCPECGEAIQASVLAKPVYILQSCRPPLGPQGTKDTFCVNLRGWTFSSLAGLFGVDAILDGSYAGTIKEIELTGFDPANPSLDAKDEHYKGVVRIILDLDEKENE